jgi:hypothetical protein
MGGKLAAGDEHARADVAFERIGDAPVDRSVILRKSW